jgi:adenosylcobinamide-phosphate synthase
MTGTGLMLVALLIDAALGWPRPLFQALGHPVTWMGRVIGLVDGWLNLDGTEAGARRRAGVIGALLVITVAIIPALLLDWLLPDGLVGVVIGGIFAWPLVAARSLHDHVRAVAEPLGLGDLDRARAAVAEIVGRDPARLDEAGVARAALESLAENASDGVVAPLFWGALLGLPGIAAYKAINTLDSMIGHRTPRYEAFGWASARIDDLANLIPARLTGLIFAAVSGHPREAVACMWRDARHHRSPNAGWPEGAMAAGLGVRLSGPRSYHDRVVDEPWVNGEGRNPGADDILAGLRLYRTAMALAAMLLAILWLV